MALYAYEVVSVDEDGEDTGFFADYSKAVGAARASARFGAVATIYRCRVLKYDRVQLVVKVLNNEWYDERVALDRFEQKDGEVVYIKLRSGNRKAVREEDGGPTGARADRTYRTREQSNAIKAASRRYRKFKQTQKTQKAG